MILCPYWQSCQFHIYCIDFHYRWLVGVTVKREELPEKQVSVTGLSERVGRSGTVLLSPLTLWGFPRLAWGSWHTDPGMDGGMAAIDKTYTVICLDPRLWCLYGRRFLLYFPMQRTRMVKSHIMRMRIQTSGSPLDICDDFKCCRPVCWRITLEQPCKWRWMD